MMSFRERLRQIILRVSNLKVAFSDNREAGDGIGNFLRLHETKFIFLIMLFSILLAAMWASAEQLRIPTMDTKEQGTIITSEKGGNPRWKAEWIMEQFTENGGRMVSFTVKGQGRYSPFKQEVSWESKAIWKADYSFSPLSSDMVIRDMNGRLLIKERKVFDTANGIVKIEWQDYTDKTSNTEELKIPSDILAVEGIVIALRSLPFDPPRSIRTNILTNEPKNPTLYEVTLKPKGQERIKTSAGEFDCYKVELVPHLGVLSMLRVFFPKTYFWFTVDPPHFWVQYEGLENGLGTPHVIMEVMRSN
jgi:hypothetical protein